MLFRFTSLASLLVAAISVFGQVPSQWNSRGVGGGGALFAPSINPANDNEYYVGCDMSELFHSNDFGVTNSEVPFYKTQGGHYSAVQFTNNTSILYSIDYASGAPGYVPIPVKSTDGGVTWNPLPGNPDNTEEAFSINVDYNNPNRVLLSNYGALYFSSNGGTSFTNIHNAANSGSGIHVAGAFFDGNNIYVGTNDGLYVSTNGGTSFAASSITGITSGQAMFSFAGAKVGGVTRFLCLTGASSDIYVGLPGSDYSGFVKGVYTVDYGSGNWVSKLAGVNTSIDYMMFVGMAENDINTMYLAGSKNSEPAVMKSTTGGTGWTHVMKTASNVNVKTGWCGQGGDRGWSYAECPFGFTVAPNNANKVLITDFGFVHKTSDGGTNWEQAYVRPSDAHPAGANTPPKTTYHSAGIENTTCWQVVWGDANTMMAGFSDIKGVRSLDAGVTWSFNYTGHAANSMYRIAQHSNGNWYAGTSNIHDMYQSTRLTDAFLDANDANGKIICSTDKGLTWTDIKVFSHPVFWVATDPNNANRMYASVIHSTQGGIYVTQNLSSGASSTWTKLPTPPRTQGHPASIVVLNDGKVVATFSGRRTTSFTNSSGCFLYNPGTNTWTDVSHSGMLYWTKDIVLDPSDATQNTWYVSVFSGWGGAPNGLGGLYKTTNRGGSWTKLTGSQFDRVTSITFNPTNAQEAYLTTEVQGLWRSANMNAPTPTWALVSEYPFRQPERVFFNPYKTNEIWITSFGNGLKMGTVVVNYSITASSGPNGSISPSGTVSVASGDSSKFVFTPNGGYHVDSVIVDGSMVGTPSNYTFYTVTANHTIRVVYAINPPVQFTITATAGPNGTISPSGSVSVNAGDSARFTITPNSGYQIDSVIVGGVMIGTPSSYTFYIVQSNKNIRAVFAIDPPVQHTITSSSDLNGMIMPSGVTLVNENDSAVYSYMGNPGYHLDSVIVDDVFIGTPVNYTFYNVVSTHSIRVTFAQDSANQLTIMATAGPGGTINPAGNVGVVSGDSAVFSISSNPGYFVASVVVDGVSIGIATGYTFYSVTTDHTIDATFIPDTFEIISGSGPNGSISPLGSTSYVTGDSALFTFTPNIGFHLDSLLVDDLVQAPAADYTFYNILENHTIRVVYAANAPDTFSVVSSTGPNGAISPLGTTRVVAGDSAVFTMSPNPNFLVDSVIVDGAMIGSPLSYTFYAVSSGHTIRVTFKQDPSGVSATELTAWNIWPNPALKTIHIDLDLLQASGVRISLLNTLGQELKTIVDQRFNSGSQSLNVGLTELNLAPGVYYISINTNSGKQLKTLIVQ